ncbi:MAG: pyruvate dehydrogenase (acetyl-transferring) E1 component subunit alpha, partial [Gemmatimonadetes bacterium]|nr:pyruvate dehydrogenase (acetyl-transferring) E1 component subunit alpha [Gemmatimonadota bacterium]
PTSDQTATPRLVTKAKAYGIPGITIDGNDVLVVYEATRDAVEKARAGAGTFMIEVVTYRRKGHAEHDDQRYQPKEEIAEWAEHNDPIDRYTATLLEQEWVTRAELDDIARRVSTELNQAVEECENDPLPDGATALSRAYARPPQVEPLWFRRLDG